MLLIKTGRLLNEVENKRTLITSACERAAVIFYCISRHIELIDRWTFRKNKLLQLLIFLWCYKRVYGFVWWAALNFTSVHTNTTAATRLKTELILTLWYLFPSRTYQTVKLLYCFGIFITFALQFYVPAEIIIPPVLARVPERWEKPIDLLLRTFLVIITCK